MNPIAEDILMHYGVKRRSGRYPWGSGEDPYQHSGDFLSRVQELKKQGLSETDIVESMGLDSTTQLRVAYKVAKNERRRLQVDRAKSLSEDGLGATEIGKKMGLPESTVRSLLNESSEKRMNQGETTANILKKEIAEKRVIDIGPGVELELGISRNTLEEARFMLEAEGYNVYGVGISQPNNPSQRTTVQALCDPSVEYKELYQDTSIIKSVGNYHSADGGNSFTKLEYPASIDSKRVSIRYGDEGGLGKDGVIEIRRGVADLDLGNSHYAQVRILVDGTHYLKGMAMYSDTIPDGADIVFNTNKSSGTDKMKVLKKIKDDPDNPFGATIKANGQAYYDDPNGKYTNPITGKKQSLSAINKLREEGEWDTMSKNLSSQFLSKQPISLIKKQLKLTYDDYAAEYDDICSINNPTIKKKMLLDFADNCDSATVHLKAAALPRQKTQVLLPIDELKDNEIYAPNYRNGEMVALVRYPHAGTFEIPVLKVNNKNPAAKSILGDVTDAVGINSKVAEKLSGADFDGDTAVVIPTNDKVKIKSRNLLTDLAGFDAKTKYSTEGMSGVRLMKKSEKQKEMGIVSNLITDMTLRGATDDELARAVKHSMVVIDAEKHKLDYKRSEKENGIAELKNKYQIRVDEDGEIKTGGASTLLSRRKQTVQVSERQGSGRIDPETGEVIYKESGRTYLDPKTGQTKQAMTDVKLLNYTDDLYSLSSGTAQEDAYADYGNKMKALANQARKEYVTTGNLKYDKNAKLTYKKEVDALNLKLDEALKNAPKERRAIAIANSVVKAKMQDNPGMTKEEIKKAKHLAMNNARASVGASGKNKNFNITDREWEAIQAGAITENTLNKILRYADQDDLRQRATPRSTTALSTAQINKIKSMKNSGYTNAEIADALGKSTSTVSKYLAS